MDLRREIISPALINCEKKNKMDSTTEETTSELKDITNLPSPKRKKRRVTRGKVAKKKPRMKRTKTHKERREHLKKKARAPNTNKGLLCCSATKNINQNNTIVDKRKLANKF